MDAVILGVPADSVDEYWERIAPILEPALTRTIAGSLYDLEDIRGYLKARDMQLWLWVEDTKVISGFVTQILIYPKKRVLDVVLLAGQGIKDTFQDNHEELAVYAREHSCESIRGYGRLGWARFLRGLNIQPSIYFDYPVEGVLK